MFTNVRARKEVSVIVSVVVVMTLLTLLLIVHEYFASLVIPQTFIGQRGSL